MYHVNGECKYKFDRRNWNSDQWWNNGKCWSESKKSHVCEKDYVWNPATYNCKDGKYLASIMDDSAIKCDEIIQSYEEDALAKSYNNKKATCKTQNFYILLPFLLIL